MPLTDTALRKAEPGPKPRKLADGRGLYIEVSPAGGKWWRLKYRIDSKEKRISLGVYPEVGIKAAREAADAARALLKQGLDPSSQRKADKGLQAAQRAAIEREESGLPAENSFEAIAREWFATRKEEWAEKYADKIIGRLQADVFPFIGRAGVGDITPPMLLAVLRRVEARGVIETAHRTLEHCSQVFRYAVATGKTESNPARDLKGALKRAMPAHFPAITDPARLGELLRAMQAYRGSAVVRAALHIMPLVLLRPGELRMASWDEIDFDKAVWTVPAARMKRVKAGKVNGKPHVVPLAVQALQILRDLHPVTHMSRFIFRGERDHDRPMSDATVNAALRAMGFAAEEVTGHGFRATARTMLVERLGIGESLIEAQLAHSVKDSLGRAYNRTEFLASRVHMMQSWANYLDEIRGLST
ncbi:tyrosine-type recombinase/integrase [Sphingomonas sp. NCPPB 2930]